MTFAPALLARRAQVVFSMAGRRQHRHLCRGSSERRQPQRLTSRPGIDTAPATRPTAARIVFESDRSGSQQLYVMNADGSGQRRISFGGGRYASPVWSPRGDLIAFTRIGGDAFASA